MAFPTNTLSFIPLYFFVASLCSADQAIKFYGVSSKSPESCSCYYRQVRLSISAREDSLECLLPESVRTKFDKSEAHVILTCSSWDSKEIMHQIQLSPHKHEPPSNETCSRLPPPKNSPLPSVFLASFPRTGNTWTRSLIETATGYCTGSVYNETAHTIQKICLNRIDDIVLLKTHYPAIPPFPLRDASSVILLTRNYFDCALSYFHLTKTKSVYNSVRYSEADPVAWRHHLLKTANTYVAFFNYWLNVSQRKTLQVAYETLHKEKKLLIFKMVDFLGLPRDYQRIECAIALDVIQETGREGSPEMGGSLKYYTSEGLEENLSKVEKIMNQLHYEKFVDSVKQIIAFKKITKIHLISMRQRRILIVLKLEQSEDALGR